MSPVRRIQWLKRYKRYVAGAVALVTVAAAGVATYTGGSDANVPGPTGGGGSTPTTLLDLQADVDFGSLPTRTAFCGSVGTLGTPEHCYDLQEASGNLADSGAGSLTLTAGGTPRYAVETGLPVYNGAAVSWTGEHGIHMDGSGEFTGTDTLPAAGSITVVWQAHDDGGAADYLGDWGYSGGAGVRLRLDGGVLTVNLDFGTGRGNSISGLDPQDGAWHCMTLAYNGASTVAWVDGAAVSWTGAWADAGSTTSAQSVAIGALSSGAASMAGGVARYRVDHDVAAIADHQSLCGSWGIPVRRDKTAPAYADITYARTGGVHCLPTSATAAYCAGTDAPAYYWDGTDHRWLFDGTGRINRLPDSGAVTCSDWTCATSTIAASVAPDGSKTAASITHGGGTVTSPAASGYGASATLYPVMWVKCSSGTLSITHSGGNGDWDVTCATIGGAWTLLTGGAHAAVTENTAWQSTAGGALTVVFQGADAEVWMPTFTETPDTIGVVVPTGAASSDTGAGVMTIVNAANAYWKAGDTVTSDLTEILGTCFITGNPLRLSGAGGSECTGGWKSLKVER